MGFFILSGKGAGIPATLTLFEAVG
jgi:hypothetical protein